MRILIVGNDGGTNVGGSFRRAADRLGWTAALLASRLAMDAPWLVRQVSWRFLGRRPPRLRRFSAVVRETLESFQPEVVVATGLAPITAEVLEKAARLGIRTVNYLTDDPFSLAHRAKWFLSALVRYQMVASPRQTNLDQLRKAGCQGVGYLPFAYDPELHFPVPPRLEMACDALFVGGYEPERAPFLQALVRNGLDVRVHGDWRWRARGGLAPAYRGHVGPEELRAATCSARVNVVMGRRENRDGHTMRTFEVAACRAPILAEDTPEHRDLLSGFLDADCFFSCPDDLTAKTRRLLAHPQRAAELAAGGWRWATDGAHRYDDRLAELVTMKHDRPSAP